MAACTRMASYEFDGRVAFVTGAARGQGRSHAWEYAEHGADVVVTDICSNDAEAPYELGGREDLEATAEGVEDRGGTALVRPMDVTDAAEVDAVVEAAIDRFGRIDFLANNAGVAPISLLTDLEESTWDRALEVNLKGTWLCAKHVAAQMRGQADGGAIVNTSSTAGLRAAPGQGHYTAAKHGVIGLTKCLAVELAADGVRVNAVCPAAVETPMTDGIVEAMTEEVAAIAEDAGTSNFLGEIIEPRDVSAAFMWLSSDDARYVTGVALPVAGGTTAV